MAALSAAATLASTVSGRRRGSCRSRVRDRVAESVVKLPHDIHLERTVLAAVASPHRYRLRALNEIGADVFYDGYHQRIVSALRAGTSLSDADNAYVDLVSHTAWPLCRGYIERLHDLADRRARALRLVRELEDLATV
jgi:hypothetical protein